MGTNDTLGMEHGTARAVGLGPVLLWVQRIHPELIPTGSKSKDEYSSEIPQNVQNARLYGLRPRPLKELSTKEERLGKMIFCVSFSGVEDYEVWKRAACCEYSGFERVQESQKRVGIGVG